MLQKFPPPTVYGRIVCRIIGVCFNVCSSRPPSLCLPKGGTSSSQTDMTELSRLHTQLDEKSNLLEESDQNIEKLVSFGHTCVCVCVCARVCVCTCALGYN